MAGACERPCSGAVEAVRASTPRRGVAPRKGDGGRASLPSSSVRAALPAGRDTARWPPDAARAPGNRHDSMSWSESRAHAAGAGRGPRAAGTQVASRGPV